MSAGLLPIAMKVSAKLIGLDLVSVQPMAAPSAQFYYGGETKSQREARLALERSEARNKAIDEILKDLE